MAEIIVEEKGKGGKKKAKKHPPHLDMTPMVDLMCLLITFFMLTTAFSKSKVMEIILPEKLKDDKPQEAPRISASRTLNIILGPNNKLYWYPGAVKPEDVPKLADRISGFGADKAEGVVIKNLAAGVFGKFINLE